MQNSLRSLCRRLAEKEATTLFVKTKGTAPEDTFYTRVEPESVRRERPHAHAAGVAAARFAADVLSVETPTVRWIRRAESPERAGLALALDDSARGLLKVNRATLRGCAGSGWIALRATLGARQAARVAFHETRHIWHEEQPYVADPEADAERFALRMIDWHWEDLKAAIDETLSEPDESGAMEQETIGADSFSQVGATEASHLYEWGR